MLIISYHYCFINTFRETITANINNDKSNNVVLVDKKSSTYCTTLIHSSSSSSTNTSKLVLPISMAMSYRGISVSASQ